MRLLSFELFEKVQPEWFKKNPKFYLSKAEKELKNYKDEQGEKELSNQDYINQLKKLNVDDIKIDLNEEWKSYETIEPSFLIGNRFRIFKDEISVRFKAKDENNYKIILAFVKYIKQDTINLLDIGKETINPLFKELTDYYALFYQIAGNGLFLTKDRDVYKNKIAELRKSGQKIYYFNNKTGEYL